MIKITLGKNPTSLENFSQIREQINFLNRPGKQIDWKLVENLSTKIFVDNGFDLQTLCYYTVAQRYLSDNVILLTENLGKIAIVLISYWKEIYPMDIQARINSLNWLNKHISTLIINLNERDINLKQLYRLEHNLNLIVEHIEHYQQDNQYFCNLKNMLVFVQQKIEKLTKPLNHYTENKNAIIETEKISKLENKQILTKNKANTSTDKPIQVNPDKKEVKSKENLKDTEIYLSHLSSLPQKVSYWKYIITFFVGVIFALMGNYLYQQRQLDVNSTLVEILDNPLYAFEQGTDLLEQAGKTWFISSEMTLAQWQEKINQYANQITFEFPEDTLRVQLNQLQQELLNAERTKRGLTISHLKTALYDMERQLNQQQSLEDLFEQYRQTKDNRLKQAIEQKLMVLLAYYYRLNQDNAE